MSEPYSADMTDHLAGKMALRDPNVKAGILRFGSLEAALEDSDFNAVMDAAYDASFQALIQDPIQFERQEAARLLDLVKRNHADPNATWRYLGENDITDPTSPVYRLGRWKGPDSNHREHPADIESVFDLQSTIRLIDMAKHEASTLLAAKNLGLYLERAQRACGERTITEEAAGMNERPKQVLRALFLSKAFDAFAEITTPMLFDLLEGCPDEEHVRHCIKDLISDGLIAEKGQKRYRRIWLTLRGRAVAEFISRDVFFDP